MGGGFAGKQHMCWRSQSSWGQGGQSLGRGPAENGCGWLVSSRKGKEGVGGRRVWHVLRKKVQELVWGTS